MPVQNHMREKKPEYKYRRIQKTVRYATLSALFLIPAFSLVTLNSSLFPFIDGKAFFFRILVEVAFAGWIILAFIDAKYRPKLTPLTIAVTLFALITLIADIFGVDPVHSLWSNFERMEGWITIIHLWAFYMVITNVFGSEDGEKRLWNTWLNVSLVAAAIVGLGGLCQMFGWTGFNDIPGRADAFLGNAEFVAGYMLFHIFIAAYLFLVSRAKKMKGMMFPRWVYPVMFVLFGSVLFGTQTRGTILGLICGLLLALALYAVFGKSEPRVWRWISGGAIVLVLLVGTLFWFNRDNSFVEHNSILSRFASISLTDASNQSRLYIWPMAVKGGMERPILGWGQENFSYIFQAEYNPAMYNMEQWFDRAHNVFLDWFINAGFIGLAAYLALFVLFLVCVWKSSLSVTEKSVLTGLLVGYTIHGMFVFDNLASYIMFFFLLGYLDSFKQGKSIKWLGIDSAQAETVKYAVLPIVGVALLATIYFFNVRQIIVSDDFVAAISSCLNNNPPVEFFRSALNANMTWANEEIDERLFSCAVIAYGEPLVPYNQQKAIVDLATAAGKARTATAPDDARGYYYAGTFLDQVGQTGLAQGFLERAHKLSPAKQQMSFELAANYMYQRQYDEAVSVLKSTYKSAPGYAKAASAYAVALAIDGKMSEARIIPGVDPALLDRVESYISAGKNYLDPIIIYQGVIVDTSDFTFILQQARREAGAGMVDQSIQTLQTIENIYPEYKNLAESAIQQLRVQEISIPKK
jgi:O-antigen ligase